nr:pre-mRNA-processing-splicing factor 8A [Ipomoea trifida]
MCAKDNTQLTAVTRRTTNVHGDELIVTTTSPYEQSNYASKTDCRVRAIFATNLYHKPQKAEGVASHRPGVGQRLGVVHYLGIVQGLGVVHGLEVAHGLEVVLQLLVPSPTWSCFGASAPRNLCFAFTPSASRSAALPRGRSRPRGRPQPLVFQVPLGLILVLRTHETSVLPSRHETCVLPSRPETCIFPSSLVPRGRPHRLGVVQGLGVVHGLEVVLHLLVPSPMKLVFRLHAMRLVFCLHA